MSARLRGEPPAGELAPTSPGGGISVSGSGELQVSVVTLARPVGGRHDVAASDHCQAGPSADFPGSGEPGGRSRNLAADATHMPGRSGPATGVPGVISARGADSGESACRARSVSPLAIASSGPRAPVDLDTTA